jgi:hypothetical protein
MIGTTEIIVILAFLFLLAVPVIIVVGVVLLANRNKQSNANLKPCPFCAEMIQVQAKVCRFCGRDLSV